MISASGEWKPKARRAIRRMRVLTDWVRAWESPKLSAAALPPRWAAISCARRTKEGRQAQATRPRWTRGRDSQLQLEVDILQALLE